jgi:hypothetical protein
MDSQDRQDGNPGARFIRDMELLSRKLRESFIYFHSIPTFFKKTIYSARF